MSQKPTVISESFIIHKEVPADKRGFFNKLLNILSHRHIPKVTVSFYLNLSDGSVIRSSVVKRGYLNHEEYRELKTQTSAQAYSIFNKTI